MPLILIFILVLLFCGGGGGYYLGGPAYGGGLGAVAIVLLNIREAVGRAHPLAEDTVPDLWPFTD